ncbi:hypothetical protein SDC9_111357 [bioreactor metagenome]|uniref:Uncharacterized protein n=1 Tax=bioreactor metagenome TaxID=1076179 RepID=A0A645BIS7_9ZZZZ
MKVMMPRLSALLELLHLSCGRTPKLHHAINYSTPFPDRLRISESAQLHATSAGNHGGSD